MSSPRRKGQKKQKSLKQIQKSFAPQYRHCAQNFCAWSSHGRALLGVMGRTALYLKVALRTRPLARSRPHPVAGLWTGAKASWPPTAAAPDRWSGVMAHCAKRLRDRFPQELARKRPTEREREREGERERETERERDRDRERKEKEKENTNK